MAITKKDIKVLKNLRVKGSPTDIDEDLGYHDGFQIIQKLYRLDYLDKDPGHREPHYTTNQKGKEFLAKLRGKTVKVKRPTEAGLMKLIKKSTHKEFRDAGNYKTISIEGVRYQMDDVNSVLSKMVTKGKLRKGKKIKGHPYLKRYIPVKKRKK